MNTQEPTLTLHLSREHGVSKKQISDMLQGVDYGMSVDSSRRGFCANLAVKEAPPEQIPEAYYC